ncbi:hypothetical protein [Paenibacillus sp. Leaf72]|uniref:hypothetical protein n=1 Tax=Paenibacillus sp. Leaf72 TaxID=1736234 RepID=UPI000700862B|nr:hypothetical protein [Paenibacillus sp. Leaf72]KQN96780.1 hypothetical protein ASF12_22165 [Paenibacillus sp. Leaf72]
MASACFSSGPVRSAYQRMLLLAEEHASWLFLPKVPVAAGYFRQFSAVGQAGFTNYQLLGAAAVGVPG